jgi:hypothetical protein
LLSGGKLADILLQARPRSGRKGSAARDQFNANKPADVGGNGFASMDEPGKGKEDRCENMLVA